MLLLQTTGLSGAGKTTLSNLVRARLAKLNLNCIVIDGDTYRQSLCKDLGFSQADRIENIRRLGAEAHRHAQQGTIAIIAAINPFEQSRRELGEMYGAKTIWVDCAMQTLIARDTKGLYKRALLLNNHPKKLNNLTGVNDIYEAPENPDLHICTHLLTPEEACERMLNFILATLEPSVIPQADYKE
ncbi:adenylyl-sulfate kinase [Mucilaginibacter agri]|uniref:Adenylyl-sulfate kinase n=1 Tax=Mucilaginibacter agri TaxID=2695265 RepID=A0A965ZIA2_9SPHI|nr:adenylyl-sulfate kinase [Mucilaginibacter agri]NCD70232.1 adenylyl-sulfate kinase [Mucilaginibacter agri]